MRQLIIVRACAHLPTLVPPIALTPAAPSMPLDGSAVDPALTHLLAAIDRPYGGYIR